MKSRIMAALLVMLLLVGLVSTVGAQDTSTCLNLSDADCTILMNAEAAAVTSANIDISASFSVTGISMLSPGTDDINAEFTGTGAFQLVDGSVPPLAFKLDGSGSAAGETTNVSVVIVDGVAYGMDSSGDGKWHGVKIEDLAASMGLPLDQLMSGDLSALTDMMGAMGGATGGTTAATPDYSALEGIPGFLTMSRLADDTMDSQTMYPFSLDVDFAPLFNSPEFGQMMNEAMSMAGGAAGSDPSTAQMMAMIPMFLQGTTITANVTQWVGADDGFIHKVSGDLNATVDLSALMGASGGAGTTGSPAMPPINVTGHFEVTLTNLNGSVDISAPAGATMESMN